MDRYKFIVGQLVKIKMYNPWIGDYEAPATIIGIDNVFLNGIPTYVVRAFNNEIWCQISENKIILIYKQEHDEQS